MKTVHLIYKDRDPNYDGKKYTIEGNNDIEIFETFYKKNNNLRYCNGSYYVFKDNDWSIKYKKWLNSDDYKSKSFNLYYGNGVVD